MSEADVIDESAASTPRRVVHYVHEIRYHVSFIEASTHPATSHLADAVRTDGHSARPFVVIDRAVDLLHGEALRLYLASHGLHDPDRWLAIDASAKDGRVLDSILHRFIDVELERHAVVLAVGGGTVLDVAGLAASLHRRGTSFVRVPTSLVGVIDAAVGVKTGIDYRGRKNRLGSYAPPRSVLIDLSFLDTLPEREWRNGLAEAIKMGAIADAVLARDPRVLAGACIVLALAGLAAAVGPASRAMRVDPATVLRTD